MDQVFTFHETVRGHLHVMNEFPCEDSSSSFSAENGRYHIAIVADGHGSKSCFRSDYGSKVATEVALDCLQQFAEATLASEELEERFYKDIFSNPRYRHMTVRRLTDTILAEWHDRVLEDYKNNPPTLEEMGESATEYQNGKNPAHIYGTTLIAALKMSQCLILLHQGDGRCDVFYEDGSVDQPIPWDSRCEDTATTSLCDEDAAERFRSCVLNLAEKPVIACYVGCDGVEDAYRDTYEGLGGSHVLMGGVHAFYKYLTCQIVQMGDEAFKSWLPDFLAKFSADGIFSRSGSGDDVSVSGIVDLSRINSFTEGYAYEEDLSWREDELRRKTRKHGILKKRFDDAKLAYENASVTQNTLTESLEQLQSFRIEFARKIEAAKEELEDYRQDAESATGQIEGRYATRFATAMQRFIEEISTGYSQKEAAYSKMLEQLVQLDGKIIQIEEQIECGKKNLLELETKRDEAQSAFEEYDTKYQAIDVERGKIADQIKALKEGMQG